jgi:hypothetical protein
MALHYFAMVSLARVGASGGGLLHVGRTSARRSDDGANNRGSLLANLPDLHFRLRSRSNSAQERVALMAANRKAGPAELTFILPVRGHATRPLLFLALLGLGQ